MADESSTSTSSSGSTSTKTAAKTTSTAADDPYAWRESTEPLTPEEAAALRQEKKDESLAATGGEYPETPSGLALAEVGDLDGEDAADSDEARESGLAYAKAKRKYRWGY